MVGVGHVDFGLYLGLAFDERVDLDDHLGDEEEMLVDD